MYLVLTIESCRDVDCMYLVLTIESCRDVDCIVSLFMLLKLIKINYCIISWQNSLRWYGHVSRKDEGDLVRKCLVYGMR